MFLCKINKMSTYFTFYVTILLHMYHLLFIVIYFCVKLLNVYCLDIIDWKIVCFWILLWIFIPISWVFMWNCVNYCIYSWVPIHMNFYWIWNMTFLLSIIECYCVFIVHLCIDIKIYRYIDILIWVLSLYLLYL